jgi:hypothetical protein
LAGPLDGGNRMWYQIIIEPSEGYAHTYECSGEHGATPNCERDENYQYDYMIMDMAPGPTLKRFRSEFSGWTLGELYQPGEVRVCKGLSLPEYGFTKSGGWLYFGMLERTRRGRKPKVKA